MAGRSRVSTKHSVKSVEKVPAWIQRRASERPVARWIAWDGKRQRTDQPAAVNDSEPQPAPDTTDGAAIVYIAQWKAARRR